LPKVTVRLGWLASIVQSEAPRPGQVVDERAHLRRQISAARIDRVKRRVDHGVLRQDLDQSAGLEILLDEKQREKCESHALERGTIPPSLRSALTRIERLLFISSSTLKRPCEAASPRDRGGQLERHLVDRLHQRAACRTVSGDLSRRSPADRGHAGGFRRSVREALQKDVRGFVPKS
jgi:hypothetical protein